jgi:hypothetical protein
VLHSSQKFIPLGFSNPQLPQCMVPFYSFGLAWARKTGTPVIAPITRRGERVVLSIAGQKWLPLDCCDYREEDVSA